MGKHVARRKRRGRPGLRAVTLTGVAVVGAACVVAGPAHASSNAVVTGLWHLDETSGNIAFDSSGNGNNGTTHDAEIGQPGRFGTAYSFVPEGSWVEVPSSTGLNPGTQDFSFSAWLKISSPPSTGQTYDPVRKGLTTTKTGDFKLEMFNGGKFRCIAKDSARTAASIYGPAHNYADGNWHQVTCARTGSTWSITIDGVTRSKQVNLTSISNTAALSIGSKYGEEDDVNGLVDEVQFTVG